MRLNADSLEMQLRQIGDYPIIDKLTLEELVNYLSELPLPFKLKTNLPYDRKEAAHKTY